MLGHSLAFIPLIRSRQEHLNPFIVACFPFLLTACAYRFTNSHIERPEGIESIAVEAVYDTGREVLSHEIIWDELQAALAADGHLKVLPRHSADAILRAHIKTAEIAPGGTVSAQKDPEKDPKVFSNPVPDVDEFRRMTQAHQVHNDGVLTVVLEVEVVSMRTKDVLLKRNYNMSKSFKAVHASANDTTTTTLDNDFLRYEEVVETKLRLAAKDISRQVVQDLLIR